MQEFPPKLTVEPGYGLRLVGTAAAGEELTEFHKYGPLFVLTYVVVVVASQTFGP